MSGPERYIAESAIFGDTNLVDWTIAPAMRTVAANAKSVEEARGLLEMLGLIEPRPKSDAEPVVACKRRCASCNRPGRHSSESLRKWPGTVAIVGRGMCRACYDVVLKEEKRARDDVA
ncbi:MULTISPECIES: hypothetical protein [Rhodococcus]|uniref:hypothetical protein n=1 Tax=Rhodococcus TaxID=1827 RepID=UPI00051A8581|nr:hypothetical protein [Rhodococcus pyridinivorans]MCD2116767.1 hypothetical protein [Rhodococcus pyridinivorans]MCZ4626025.1 hypothetical protein [Rhodococcus pyridinivorans]MCZ4646980.1 hypothetical protein [Rhodococcus pyridinivorans]MDJ0480332.1 hypothetical protein [Rhodococcus pyridinivorans]MDV7253084.1 hypothetical protein [Rhodococcus pyridinivorans]